MAIIGNIIKAGIAIRQEFKASFDNTLETQRKQLQRLLNEAKSTAFGTYYGFKNILESENPIKTFQQKVPVHDYEKMHARWWLQQQTEENITWPGKPDYFALSASTTGEESKRIPVTEAMLDSIRSVGIEQFTSLTNFDLPPEFFERDLLMLSSTSDLKKHKDHLEGEISGITVQNFPDWFKGFYKPGLDIAAISDWDERVEEIARQAPNWDIAGMSGIPSWIQLMLRRIIEYHKVNNIHDVWPNLQVYASGGVAFEPYRKSFDELMAKPIHVLDTYLASEGFFAYTARPGTLSMRLAINHDIFYEFIPFDERGFDDLGNLLEDPLALTIDQVEKDQTYAMIVSTPAGAWRYMIGDTVKFTDKERLEIELTGRTKFWLNVAGSQLAEDKMNAAIKELSEYLNVKIEEFSVSAMSVGDGKYMHQWVLGSDKPFPESKAAAQLDTIIKRINKAYAMARTKALQSMEVKQISKDTFYSWLEKDKKKGGQTKTPKVLPEERMSAFLDFIKETS